MYRPLTGAATFKSPLLLVEIPGVKGNLRADLFPGICSRFAVQGSRFAPRNGDKFPLSDAAGYIRQREWNPHELGTIRRRRKVRALESKRRRVSEALEAAG